MQKRATKKAVAATKSAASTSAPPTAPLPEVEEHEATWASIDPRNNQMVPYDPALSQRIESAYKGGCATLDFTLGGAPFQVTFATMTQKNSSGGTRKVVRSVPVDFSPPLPLTPTEVESILRTVAAIDKAIEDFEKREDDRRVKLDLGSIDRTPVVDAINRIIQGFKVDRYRAKYGCDDNADAFALSLALGASVPNYFANVTDQSIYQRKMLSLCGLRNLILCGPEIFEEMRAKLFSGRLADYGAKEGPHKMRYYTGNAVDLDYVVLRCNDRAVLSAINAQQKKAGLPPFTGTKDFASSEVAKRIAVAQAQELIQAFINRFKISPAEAAARYLVLPQDPLNIHVATGNEDRGNHPLWHYSNVGQSSYHVNVPNMPDVYGALLKAPFHLVKGFALIFARYTIGSTNFIKALDTFYDEAVADSCFNAKWKAIEEFVATIDARGSIPVVLAEIQAANQQQFTQEFFDSDPDHQKEAQLMLQLSAHTLARDPVTGTTRLITRADIDAWIQSQSAY